MSKYFVRTADGNSGEIEADGYSIIGELLRFWTEKGYVAMFNVAYLISVCLIDEGDET